MKKFLVISILSFSLFSQARSPFSVYTPQVGDNQKMSFDYDGDGKADIEVAYYKLIENSLTFIVITDNSDPDFITTLVVETGMDRFEELLYNNMTLNEISGYHVIEPYGFSVEPTTAFNLKMQTRAANIVKMFAEFKNEQRLK